MRKLLIIAAILVCATGFGQSSPDIVLKVIPGSLTAQYQQQVEYKAYLYNRSKEPVKIVNPNFSEPAWKFYKDEWLVLDANGKNVNTLGGYCGVASPFQDKDITTIQPGDSLYVRYFRFKFADAGKFTVKYVLDHNPAYSAYYKTKRSASTLTAFRAESNELVYTIRKQELTEIKTIKLLSGEELWKEKTYTTIADAFANAEKVYKLEVSGVKQEDFNSICKLKNLRLLTVSGAQIDSFPAAFNDLHLLSLSLIIERSNDQPLMVPKAIGKMTEMYSLFFKNGSNMVLPEELGNLQQLTSFSAIYCNFERLPASFGNLKKLNTLTIRYNHKLTGLPAMNDLTDLRSLEISECELLTQFPSVFRAASLSNLNLSTNSITVIPAEVAALKGLNYLVMDRNKLTGLPPQLLELPVLRLLNVRENSIATDETVKNLQKKLAKGFFK